MLRSHATKKPDLGLLGRIQPARFVTHERAKVQRQRWLLGSRCVALEDPALSKAGEANQHGSPRAARSSDSQTQIAIALALLQITEGARVAALQVDETQTKQQHEPNSQQPTRGAIGDGRQSSEQH